MINFRTTAFLISSLFAGAESVNADMQMLGSNPPEFVAGLFNSYSFASQPNGLAAQRRSNWCWAATIAFVLRENGISVSQEEIVARMFGGSLPNQAASMGMMHAALSGWGISNAGNPVTIQSDSSPVQIHEFISELREDRPILMVARTPGGTRHAYVITKVQYYFPPASSPEYNGGDPILTKFSVLDPWPMSPKVSTWTANYLYQHSEAFIRVRVQ